MTTKHSSFLYGSLFILLSTLFLALGYLVAKLTTPELPFFVLVFCRYFLGLVLLIFFLLFRRKLIQSLLTKKFHMHLLRGAIVTCSQCLLFIYLSKGTLLNASLFMNLAPVYIPLLERLFYQRKVGLSTKVSMVLSSIGIIFILKPGSDLFTPISLVGLISGVFWALSQILYGHNIRSERREINMFYLFFTCSLLTLPSLWFYPESITLAVQKDAILPLLLTALALVTLLSQYYRAHAFHFYHPSALSVFLYFTIVISGFLDWVIFHEIPSTTTLIGAAFIITGGIAKVLSRSYILKKQ